MLQFSNYKAILFCWKGINPSVEPINVFFAVAHRLSSIRNVTRIIVLVDGEIAEQGTVFAMHG